MERRRNADVDPLMSRWPLAYPVSIGTLQAGDWPSSVPDLLTAEGRLGVALGESRRGGARRPRGDRRAPPAPPIPGWPTTPST